MLDRFPMNLYTVICLRHCISSEYKSFTEGFLNFDDLLSHLKNHKTSKAISIIEDTTRVISRVDYDCKTDRHLDVWVLVF